MNVQSFLQRFNQHFDAGVVCSEQIRCERIDGLMDQLKEKEIRLQHNLAEDKDLGRYKRLKLELKIVQVQYKKAKERRDELSLAAPHQDLIGY